MLEIQDLHVSVHGTPVLKGIDLKVEAGETFILFGPNGSGKTTLLMTLMGFSGYEVTRGKIIFKGHDITYAPMYERARLGIGMSFQRPPTIPRPAHGQDGGTVRPRPQDGHPRHGQARAFRYLPGPRRQRRFLRREIKRSELLQLMAQQPNLLLFRRAGIRRGPGKHGPVARPCASCWTACPTAVAPPCASRVASVPPAGSSSPTPATSLNTSRRPRTGHVSRQALL